MELFLIIDESFKKNIFTKVCNFFNELQDQIKISLIDDTFSTILDSNNELYIDENFDILIEKSYHNENKNYLLLTQKKLKDNYFARYIENLSIFSAFKWEYCTEVSLQTGLIYAIILEIFWLNDRGHKFHPDTRGCPFDLVVYKPDIDIGLRNGRLCDECYNHFKNIVPESMFIKLLELLDIVAFMSCTGRYPRFVKSSQKDPEVLPFVPSTSRYYNPSRENIFEISKFYQDLKNSKSKNVPSDIKGRSLELFCKSVFSNIEGFECYDSNIRLQDCEVDLSFKINSEISDLHRAIAPVVFIECKNRNKTASVADISHHIMNLAERKLNGGIFVSTSGISGYAPSKEKYIKDSLGKIVSAYRQFDILVLPFVWDDIQALKNGMNLFEILDNKRMEIIHQ